MGSTQTVKERQEAQRKEKLRDIRRQIREGSLVVRKMTPAERKAADKRLQELTTKA